MLLETSYMKHYRSATVLYSRNNKNLFNLLALLATYTRYDIQIKYSSL